jgi:hypothetical protein
MGAFQAVSFRGISTVRVSAMVFRRTGRSVSADCLEKDRWQNGHSREVSTLIDVTITSMVQLVW